MDLLDIYAKLTLDSSGYEDGIGEAEESASSFGKKLSKGLSSAGKTAGKALLGVGAGAVAATGAMIAVANSTADYGDHVDKQSQKLGISAEAYQEWDAVLQHSGTSIDSMGASFKKLSKAAQDGSADQVEAFSQLGISMEDAASMSPEELFSATITGLQGMEEGTERTTLATKLLGNGAIELGALLNTSAEETQEMKDRVHELGGVMSDEGISASADFKDNVQDLQTAFTGVKNSIGEQVLPILNDFMSFAIDNMPEIKKTINEAIEAIGTVLSGFWEGGSTIFTSITEGIGNIISAATGAETDWGDVWKGIQTAITNFSLAAGTVISNVTGFIANLVTEATTDGTLINTVWEGIKTAIGNLSLAAGTIINGIIGFIHNFYEQANTDGTLINSVIAGIGTIFQALKNVVSSVVSAITSLFSGDLSGAVSGIQSVFSSGFEYIKSIVTTAGGAILGIFRGVVNFFSGDAISGALDTAKGLFSSAMSAIQGIVRGVKNTVSTVFGGIGDLVTSAFEGAEKWFTGITSTVGTVFEGITTTASTWAGGIANHVSNAVDTVVNTVAGWAQAIGDFLFGSDDEEPAMLDGIAESAETETGAAETAVSENFNDIKTIVSDSSSEAVEAVSQAYVDMAADIETSLGDAYTSVTTKMADIKTAMTTTVDSILSSVGIKLLGLQGKWNSAMSDIYGTVSRYMSDIETLMNKEYKITVAVDGGAESGTVKKFAKAMNNGYLLNGATVFGEMGGTPLVGGEAGQEMIIGTNTLMGAISDASGGNQAAYMVQSYGEQIVSILAEYLPNMDGKIYLDGNKLVGGIANKMDDALGRISGRRGMVTV